MAPKIGPNNANDQSLMTAPKAAIKSFSKQWLVLFAVAALGIVQSQFAHLAHKTNIGEVNGDYWGNHANSTMIKRFLGLRTVASDLIWLDLAFKSDINRETQGYSSFFKAVNTMLDLDPQNFYGAWFGAVYLSVIKDDIPGATMLFEDTVDALEKNQWVNPQLKGAIYFAYGYHLLFEEHNEALAGRYLVKAAEMPGASLLSRELAETMGTERGQIEIGFRVLNEAYRRAKNIEEKKVVEAKMTNLLIRRELVELNDQFVEYKIRTQAHDMPRQRAFQLFLRSINHSGKDSLGRTLTLDDRGKVVASGSSH